MTINSKFNVNAIAIDWNQKQQQPAIKVTDKIADTRDLDGIKSNAPLTTSDLPAHPLALPGFGLQVEGTISGIGKTPDAAVHSFYRNMRLDQDPSHAEFLDVDRVLVHNPDDIYIDPSLEGRIVKASRETLNRTVSSLKLFDDIYFTCDEIDINAYTPGVSYVNETIIFPDGFVEAALHKYRAGCQILCYYLVGVGSGRYRRYYLRCTDLKIDNGFAIEVSPASARQPDAARQLSRLIAYILDSRQH